MKPKRPRLCVKCGEPVAKGRRSWCSDDCRDEWYENNLWPQASRAALKRAGNKCEECGSTTRLEVHHIEKLDLWRYERWNTPKNAQSNLVVLCRACHELAHHPPKPPAPTDHERAVASGQLELMHS